jgi:hypothetical protein
MTHRNIAPRTLHHVDPAEHFGIEVRPISTPCVIDYAERPYGDQLRYNTRKWTLTRSCIEAWKAQTRTASRSQYDLFAATGDSKRRDAEVAIGLVEDILTVELPKAVATARREWEAEHPRVKFNATFASFAAFYAALDIRRHLEVGAVRSHLDALYLPLRAYSHNEWPVEKLGFTPVTAAQRVVEKAARAAKTAARKAANLAQTKVEQQAEADRLEANARARGRRGIGVAR